MRVADAAELDFLTTLGREFCEALRDLDEDGILCGQDAHDVFAEGLGGPPSAGRLAGITPAEVGRVRAATAALLETAGVTDRHVRTIVERTLAHHP